MLMQALQLGAGAIGAFGALQQQKERQRIEEEYNRNAAAGLQRTRDQQENMNAMATRNAAMGQLNDAQSQAMQAAANIGAGNAAASGLGGDVVSGQLSAVKAAPALGQVAAQFGAQKAGVEQQAYMDQLQKTSALTQTNAQLGDLSKNVNYTYQNKPTLLTALAGAMGGMNAGTNAYELATGKGSAMKTNTDDAAVQAKLQQRMQRNPEFGALVAGYQ